MWLSRKLTQHEKQNTASAEAGAVTIDSGEIAVYSSGEDRNVQVASPGGFFWRPQSGERVLVIKGGTFGEEPFIVGTVRNGEALPAGEIRIAPAKGNAEILLHNNGRVEINGTLLINGMPYIPLLM
ncbi:MAG: hypothetical protein Q3995_07000 [Eubacteriales bacterium]|nr:hypothetical protein [Eubacteriales bacterium]